MPKRFIELPSPVVFRDAVTGEVALVAASPEPGSQRSTVTWDFGTILHKLMMNPKWSETFANMRAQASIQEAYEEAKTSDSKVMELAEEDWQKLKEAVETPRTLVPENGAVIPGFGLIPAMSRQLLPLLLPIVDAKTERPKGR